MNPHNTIDKMRAMRMKTMAELYHRSVNENLYSELSTDEFMATLVDGEWEERQRRKIAALIKRAAQLPKKCKYMLYVMVVVATLRYVCTSLYR